MFYINKKKAEDKFPGNEEFKLEKTNHWMKKKSFKLSKNKNRNVQYN